MPSENWILRGGRGAAIAKKYDLDPYLARILAVRCKEESVEEYLNREGQLFDPLLMEDMVRAVDLIDDHLSMDKELTIVGDYDVDGLTSTTILLKGLSHLYPDASIHYRIPERISDGYGFSIDIARELEAKGVQMVLTCDNGIREFETGRYLKEQGIPLIITDHHDIMTSPDGVQAIPDAEAIINPHRTDDHSPQKTICGAFTALQLIRALWRRKRMDEKGDLVMSELTGLAAIGTICDIMPLMKENRKLVYQGLRALNYNPPTGIRCLMKEKNIRTLSPYTVGYVIGPMINAGGRLGSQNKYIRILLSDDVFECQTLAKELAALNAERQKMQEDGIAKGLDRINKDTSGDMVKVIYLPDVHESIAGLVAGKIKDEIHHPVFVATKSEKGIKGSGRSIEAYPMSQEMDKVKEVFTRYGGHQMAAGFSIDGPKGTEEDMARTMSRALNENCTLEEKDCVPSIYIDAVADPALMTLDRIRQLDILEPMGTGNPRPLIACKKVHLHKVSVYGQRKNVARLSLMTPGGDVDVISFRVPYISDFIGKCLGRDAQDRMYDGLVVDPAVTVDLVYEAGINEYHGLEKPQFILRAIRHS